ncbi:MAG: styrene monooxygenase/indole monooxygenase family protein [Bacteroidota bacterium]
MRKIAIVGAGQSGLQLALTLLQSGHQVTLVSDRTPVQIRQGRVMSSQVLFHHSLEIERKLGLNDWESQCPIIEGMSVSLVHERQQLLHFSANLDGYAQSVDQRIKLAAWLDCVAERGGRVMIQTPTIPLLEELAQENDLVVVASGKGELSQLFERDPERSPYQTPQRVLALAYLKGDWPIRTTIGFNACPGVGECFLIPALTHAGPCEIVFFEGVPSGPFDCWADVKTGEQHLEKTLDLLERYFPEQAHRYQHAQLTDNQATLSGKFTPTVRKPVARLPSGAWVLGMGDTVVLNDPITGQGANNAAKCADGYAKSIESHTGLFHAEWMQQTFDQYWTYAQWVTAWTNAMLQPLPAHVQALLGAACEVPGVAQAFVNGFDNPPDFFPWITSPAETEQFIAAGGRKTPTLQALLD